MAVDGLGEFASDLSNLFVCSSSKPDLGSSVTKNIPHKYMIYTIKRRHSIIFNAGKASMGVIRRFMNSC